MTQFDAFFLPISIDDSEIQTMRAGNVQMRWPRLSESQLHDVHRTLVAHRQRLAGIPVARIVEAIDAAAAQMHEDIAAITGLVSDVTGYSQPVVAETLEHMFSDWRSPALNDLLRGELPDPGVLDGPIPDPDIPNKYIAAHGYRSAFHVFSGNVPGVAVTSIVRSLLVKSATFGKLASGEPVLPIIFANKLRDIAPDIASCLALCYWPGDDSRTNRLAAELFDAVIVYGSDTTVHSMRANTSAQKHVVVHGPRLSFGIVGSGTDADDAAHIARAVAAYDQQGCVSPHLIYVLDTTARARQLAETVAAELEQLAGSLPRGRVNAEEAVAIRNARTSAEFADHAELFGADHAGFSVIFEQDPAFRVSCLNRVVYVKPIRDIAQLAPLLPQSEVLQSVALAGLSDNEKAELIPMLGLSGVSRVTTFQRLPWPPMHWHHDGSAPLRELIRWQDIELD